MAKRYKTIPIQINYDDQTLAPNYSSTQVPTSNIAISDNGLNFMLSFDRYRGHRYWDGEKYVMGYNYDGDAFPNGITETNAYKLWLTDVTRAQNNLRKRLNNNPTFFLQHQWDALVSFYYNTGSIDHTETEGFEFDFIHFLQNGTENEIASLLQTDNRAPTRRIAEASLFKLGNYGKFKPRIWLRNEGIQDIRQNYSKLEDKDGKIDSIAQKQAQYSYYKETGRFIKDMSELDKRLIVDLAKQDTSTVVDTSTPVDRYIVKTTTDQEYSSIATTSTATTAPAVTVIDYSASAEGTTSTTETTTGSTGSTSSQVIAAEHTHDTADWLPIGGLSGQFLSADGTWAYPSGTSLTIEEQYDTSNVSVSHTNKIIFDTSSGLHVTAGTSGVANVSLSTFSYNKKGGVPAPTISDNTKYLRGDGTWATLSGIQYADISGTPNLATVATTGAYSDLSGTPAGLTVSEINDPSANVAVSNVTNIKFDVNGGFALTDNSDGSVTVALESTFKTWKIFATSGATTSTDVVASGVDTISVKAGPGITLSGVATAGSKSLTISSSGSSDVVDDTSPQLGGNLDTNGNNIAFGDSATPGTDDTLTFGADADMSIYHDGVNSYIDDTGTGSIFIRSGTTYFQNAAGTKTSIATNSGAEQTLYYNNNAVFATASGGVTVTGNLEVTGDLTISGSTTTINTETLTIDDNIIVLNNNEAGTPSQNAGIEVERGTSPNVDIRWNETSDKWEFTNDGTNYTEIGSGGGGGGSSITVIDESTTLTTGATKFTFTGAGITATEPTTDEITINVPFDGTYGSLTGTPSLATVATSGAYGDLSGTPTIPSGNQIIDWTVSQSGSPVIHADNYTDTTYSAMSGAGAGSDGASGLVPKPFQANYQQFLRGDGTWQTPAGAWTVSNSNVTYTAGNVGVNVLDPDTELEVKGAIHISTEYSTNNQPTTPTNNDGGIVFVKADKLYFITSGSEYDLTQDTTYSVVDASTPGLAPTLPATVGDKFLKGDGTWVQPPDTTYPLTETATDNLGVGTGSLASLSTGDYNVAVGQDALTALTTGSYNVALGADTLKALQGSNYNVAIGYGALIANTSGSQNIAIGTALVSNTGGIDNVAIGHHASYSNSDGNQNISIGQSAGYATTSGDDNIAIGYEALKTNSTGSDNVAIGYRALEDAETAADNVAIGISAAKNVTGSSNTAVGKGALLGATTGDRNLAIGADAGMALTTGSNNTIIGSWLGTGSATISDTVIIASGLTERIKVDASGLSINGSPFTVPGAFTGDSGSGGTTGLVPAPAAGDAAASKFLKADGNWTVVATSEFSSSITYPSYEWTFTPTTNTGAGDTLANIGGNITSNVSQFTFAGINGTYATAKGFGDGRNIVYVKMLESGSDFEVSFRTDPVTDSNGDVNNVLKAAGNVSRIHVYENSISGSTSTLIYDSGVGFTNGTFTVTTGTDSATDYVEYKWLAGSSSATIDTNSDHTFTVKVDTTSTYRQVNFSSTGGTVQAVPNAGSINYFLQGTGDWKNIPPSNELRVYDNALVEVGRLATDATGAMANQNPFRLTVPNHQINDFDSAAKNEIQIHNYSYQYSEGKTAQVRFRGYASVIDKDTIQIDLDSSSTTIDAGSSAYSDLLISLRPLEAIAAGHWNAAKVMLVNNGLSFNHVDSTPFQPLFLTMGQTYRFDISRIASTGQYFKISSNADGTHATKLTLQNYTAGSQFEGRRVYQGSVSDYNAGTAVQGELYADEVGLDNDPLAYGSIFVSNVKKVNGQAGTFSTGQSVQDTPLINGTAPSNPQTFNVTTITAGNEITDGLTVVGSPGEVGAYVEISLKTYYSSKRLYYFGSKPGDGGVIHLRESDSKDLEIDTNGKLRYGFWDDFNATRQNYRDWNSYYSTLDNISMSLRTGQGGNANAEWAGIDLVVTEDPSTDNHTSNSPVPLNISVHPSTTYPKPAIRIEHTPSKPTDAGAGFGSGTTVPTSPASFAMDVWGMIKASGFKGDGSQLTNLPSSSASGTLPVPNDGTTSRIALYIDANSSVPQYLQARPPSSLPANQTLGWTDESTGNGTDRFFDCVWGDTGGVGTWIAVGEDGSGPLIYKSTDDGVTWSNTNVKNQSIWGSYSSVVVLTGCTWSTAHSLFVAVGHDFGSSYPGGYVVTSPDGTTWTNRTYPASWKPGGWPSTWNPFDSLSNFPMAVEADGNDILIITATNEEIESATASNSHLTGEIITSIDGINYVRRGPYCPQDQPGNGYYYGDLNDACTYWSIGVYNGTWVIGGGMSGSSNDSSNFMTSQFYEGKAGLILWSSGSPSSGTYAAGTYNYSSDYNAHALAGKWHEGHHQCHQDYKTWLQASAGTAMTYGANSDTTLSAHNEWKDIKYNAVEQKWYGCGNASSSFSPQTGQPTVSRYTMWSITDPTSSTENWAGVMESPQIGYLNNGPTVEEMAISANDFIAIGHEKNDRNDMYVGTRGDPRVWKRSASGGTFVQDTTLSKMHTGTHVWHSAKAGGSTGNTIIITGSAGTILRYYSFEAQVILPLGKAATGQILVSEDAESSLKWDFPSARSLASGSTSITVSGAEKMRILGSGEIGIGGQSAPTHPIHHSNGAHLTSAGIWTDASDVMRKSEFEPLEYGLAEVLKLTPKRYKIKDVTDIGFVAQDMEKIIPEIVSGEDAYEVDRVVRGGKGIAYGHIAPVLVNAIKELHEKNRSLEEKIDELLWLLKKK